MSHNFFLNNYKSHTEEKRRSYVYGVLGKSAEDQDFLKKCYRKETTSYIREVIAVMITDEEFKKEIAENDPNEKVRKMALVTLERSAKNAKFLWERLMLDHSSLVKDFARAILKETAPALRFIMED